MLNFLWGDNRFKEFLDFLPEWIIILSPEGIILHINSAYRALLDIQLADAVNKNFSEIFSTERGEQINRNIGKISLQTPQIEWETSAYETENKAIWEHWVARGVFDENGDLSAILLSGRDITKYKQQTSVSGKYTDEFKALHEATAALLSTLDLEPLLGKIMDAAMRAIPSAERGILYLIARDTGELEMRAVSGFPQRDPRIQRFINPSDIGYVARVVQTGSPLLIDNLEEIHTTWVDVSKGEEIALSAIIAPLILEGHILGALVLESLQKNAFTKQHLDLVTTFATTATAAIRNAQLHAEVQKIAITDSLTSLYNRRGFFELSEREVERAHRFNRPLATVMVDIDGFKNINDTYGHPAGDKVLRYVAEQCKTHTRKIDIVGRYGGDEFIILLLESDLKLAELVTERLREVIKNTPLQIDDDIVYVTVSAGIAGLTSHMPNLDALIREADNLLYQAKSAGKNRVRIQKNLSETK